MLVQISCSPTIFIRSAIRPCGVSDQVRHDVGVEQEAHQMLTSSGGSSETKGISSPSGCRVASRASSDRGGAASMLSFIAVFAHDGIIAGQFELAWNPDSLVSPILEKLDVPFWGSLPLLLRAPLASDN